MAEMLITEDMVKFIDWLVATPAMRKELGWPPNVAQEADELGYAVSTLYRWKQNAAFRYEYDRRLMESVANPDRLNGLIDKMYDLALEGSVKHAELLLKLSGKIQQGQVQVKVESGHSAKDISDADLEAEIARQAGDELAKRRSQSA